MSDLNGNPHYSEDLPEIAGTNDGTTIAAATLSLAYEQRTANLIAIHASLTNVKEGEHLTASGLKRANSIYDQIITRLGLDQP